MRKLHEHKIEGDVRQGYVCLTYSNCVASFSAIGRGCVVKNKTTKEKRLI